MTAPTAFSDYQSHLNETFVVHHDGRSTPLVLTAAKLEIDDDVQHCFVLHLSARGLDLPQAIYRLSHAQLGEFDLFLVPVQSRKGGVLYEAVFNLLKEPTP